VAARSVPRYKVRFERAGGRGRFAGVQVIELGVVRPGRLVLLSVAPGREGEAPGGALLQLCRNHVGPHWLEFLMRAKARGLLF